MQKNRRLGESTSACDSLREQLEVLLEEADLAAGRGDVERVKSILAKSRFDGLRDILCNCETHFYAFFGRHCKQLRNARSVSRTLSHPPVTAPLSSDEEDTQVKSLLFQIMMHLHQHEHHYQPQHHQYMHKASIISTFSSQASASPSRHSSASTWNLSLPRLADMQLCRLYFCLYSSILYLC